MHYVVSNKLTRNMNLALMTQNSAETNDSCANIEYFVYNYQLLFGLLDNGVTCRLNLN